MVTTIPPLSSTTTSITSKRLAEVREAVGIEEGDEVIVEIGDGITLRPVRRFDREKLKEALRRHLDRLSGIEGLREPRPGELASAYLEEEFES